MKICFIIRHLLKFFFSLNSSKFTCFSINIFVLNDIANYIVVIQINIRIFDIILIISEINLFIFWVSNTVHHLTRLINITRIRASIKENIIKIFSIKGNTGGNCRRIDDNIIILPMCVYILNMYLFNQLIWIFRVYYHPWFQSFVFH